MAGEGPGDSNRDLLEAFLGDLDLAGDGDDDGGAALLGVACVESGLVKDFDLDDEEVPEDEDADDDDDDDEEEDDDEVQESEEQLEETLRERERTKGALAES